MDEIKRNRLAVSHTETLINNTPICEDVKLLQLFVVLDEQKRILLEEK